jgi:general secretion pathway protein G
MRSALRIPGRSGQRGFTFVELLVVLAIVALLLTVTMPRYFHSLDTARETVLVNNLATTRESIDKFYGDTGRYPESLEELVEKKYLRALPIDPVTGSADSWEIVAPEDSSMGRVYDLRSSAPGSGRSEIPFSKR